MTPAQRKFLVAVRGDPGGQRAGHNGVTIASCHIRNWVSAHDVDHGGRLSDLHWHLTQRGAAALREAEQ